MGYVGEGNPPIIFRDYRYHYLNLHFPRLSHPYRYCQSPFSRGAGRNAKLAFEVAALQAAQLP